MTINIQVPKPGYYWIWGRVWGLDWSGDSFYVSVNGGPRVTWYISRGSWQWERVTKPWYLTKGPHSIQFKTREDGARLDVIEVVNSYAYVPSYVEPCGPTATSSEYTNPLQHSNTDTNSDANEHANTHAHIYADPSL